MNARFPGVCGCGCGRRFAAGAPLVRLDGGGWGLAGCGRPLAAAPAPASAGPGASTAEILEILAHATRVAERVERETAARLAGRGGPGKEASWRA